jgi:hypothetical protein
MKTGLVMLVLSSMRMLMARKSMLQSLKKGESVPVERVMEMQVKGC